MRNQGSGRGGSWAFRAPGPRPRSWPRASRPIRPFYATCKHAAGSATSKRRKPAGFPCGPIAVWRCEGNPNPGAVRLLAVLAGFVPWDGWQGWEVHKGYLFPPGYSTGGILPGEFHALVFLRQLVTAYRQDNQRLRALLDEAEARLAQRQADPGAALHLVQAAG